MIIFKGNLLIISSLLAMLLLKTPLLPSWSSQQAVYAKQCPKVRVIVTAAVSDEDEEDDEGIRRVLNSLEIRRHTDYFGSQMR